MAEDILRRVEDTLAADGGARIVHDFLDRLACEMESMAAEENGLEKEILAGLSEILAIAIPEAVVTAEGTPDLVERLKAAGVKGAIADSPPKDAKETWERMAPKLFDLRTRIRATDKLISDIVDRMYGIQRISPA